MTVLPEDWPTPAGLPNPWTRMATKIGLFLLWWSQIDQRLDWDLWLLRAGTSNQGGHLSNGVGARLKEWRAGFSPGFVSSPEQVEAFFCLLDEVGKLRNDLAHNVRGVGSSAPGEPAWAIVSSPNRRFLKEVAEWKKAAADCRGDPPSESRGRHVQEHELDHAMALVLQLSPDLLSLGRVVRDDLLARHGPPRPLRGIAP